jgi:hypothetical protein
MRQTFHEYFIYTRSKRVNAGTAAGFMGAETVSRDELGHKAFPSPQREEKRQNKSYKEGRVIHFLSFGARILGRSLFLKPRNVILVIQYTHKAIA